MTDLDYNANTNHQGCCFVDVRSPAEFLTGHIPGAINIPLFNNEERAEIGTIYKQIDPKQAMARGLEIALPKWDNILAHLTSLAQADKKIIIHCWRGGMRSGEVCRLAQESGLNPQRLHGGYKAYRRAIRAFIEQPRQLIIIGGKTGSGKTALLLALKEQGQQVIDLEGLAHHKGSVFGHINEQPQPTTEQFENNLHAELCRLDPEQPILLENESHIIGSVHLPQALLLQMRAAPLIIVEVPLTARINRLISDYTHTDRAALIQAARRIEKKLTRPKLLKVIDFLEKDDFQQAAAILLGYYDRFYNRGLEKRQNQSINFLPISGDDLSNDSAKLLRTITNMP